MAASALRMAAAALVAVSATATAGGELDPSFSGDGWVRTLTVGSLFVRGGQDAALQPDGKIVVAGAVEDSQSRWYFGVARYTSDGTLDTGFAGGGLAAIDLGSFAEAHAVAVQRDGGIVAAGQAPCTRAICFAVARFRADGSVDWAVRTEFGLFASSRAYDVAVQPDGRIVVAGVRFRGGSAEDDQVFAVARYLPDGRLDKSFSRDGRLSIDLGFGDDTAHAVAVQPDGRIVVAGQALSSGSDRAGDFGVVRLRPAGRLDRTFSGDGRATVDFGRSESARALALQRDGRVLLAGSSGRVYYVATRLAVARLRADGRLDRSFGTGGRRLLLPSPHGGSADAVAPQADGRIVVAGHVWTDKDRNSSDWLLVRYGRRGGLDPSFGRGGLVVSRLGTGGNWVGGLAVRPDGKLVASGAISGAQGLARYRSR
jgi:uncharacterized delta-60 repeat protein